MFILSLKTSEYTYYNLTFSTRYFRFVAVIQYTDT
jgi:hypothetical protein